MWHLHLRQISTLVCRKTIFSISLRHNSNFLLSSGFSPTTANESHARTPLLVYGERNHLTYNDVNRKCGRLAECMNSIYKIGKGDVVLCRTSKRHSVLLYLATLRLGAIYVPLNPSYTAQETEHFLENADPKLFVTSSWTADSHFISRVDGLSVVDERLIAEQSSLFKGVLEVETVSDSDVAAIIYTSGTTGKPKGAALSHSALRRNAQALVDNWEFTSKDVLLHTLPFYHIHGMFLSFHCTLLSKSTTIFLDTFNPSTVVEWFPKSSVFMGVPTYYSRLLASHSFTTKSCAKIRLFVSGSAPMPRALAKRFQTKSGGRPIYNRYGMSEAMVITAMPYKDSNLNSDSVGKPLRNVTIRISESGVIEVKSDCLLNGYWKDAEKTKAEFTSDKYFITGDLGRIDEHGYLYINGRAKDLIISGGLNVYPKEVEDVIETDDAIDESAVIGVPHDDFGEVVVAVCVLKSGANVDAEQHARLAASLNEKVSQKLAPYKVPKQWIFVNELMKNAMGKIEKKKLRGIYAKLFST